MGLVISDESDKTELQKSFDESPLHPANAGKIRWGARASRTIAERHLDGRDFVRSQNQREAIIVRLHSR